MPPLQAASATRSTCLRISSPSLDLWDEAIQSNIKSVSELNAILKIWESSHWYEEREGMCCAWAEAAAMEAYFLAAGKGRFCKFGIIKRMNNINEQFPDDQALFRRLSLEFLPLSFV